jgi:hypothetical protein
MRTVSLYHRHRFPAEIIGHCFRVTTDYARTRVKTHKALHDVKEPQVRDHTNWSVSFSLRWLNRWRFW